MRTGFKVFGVELELHWSFWLLLGLVMLQAGFLMGIGLFVLLVISTLFHEYSHVYVAKRQGYSTNKVIFFGLGAAAVIEVPMIEPKKELKVSLAGPIGSLILAVVFYPLTMFTENIFVAYMFLINIMLAIFNMLPIYPMDGGRVFYCVLTFFMDKIKAIKVAYITSLVLSGIGIVASIYFASVIMVIMFVFIIFLAKRQKDALIKGHMSFGCPL